MLILKTLGRLISPLPLFPVEETETLRIYCECHVKFRIPVVGGVEMPLKAQRSPQKMLDAERG